MPHAKTGEGDAVYSLPTCSTASKAGCLEEAVLTAAHAASVAAVNDHVFATRGRDSPQPSILARTTCRQTQARKNARALRFIPAGLNPVERA